MTPRFILDENVVICAQLGVDQNGDPSPVCADLLQRIIDICHTLVVDDVLWDRYEEQLHRPRHEHATSGPYLMRVLWNALATAGKIDGLGHDAPSFDDEGVIPAGSQDDTFIVRLAVETGAMLVTADEPLRQDLRDSGLAAKYGLSVLSPEEAQGHP